MEDIWRGKRFATVIFLKTVSGQMDTTFYSDDFQEMIAATYTPGKEFATIVALHPKTMVPGTVGQDGGRQ
jgi:hypothetical protein